ncbi:hypothetical protein Q5Y73_09430, partial [Chengkuizengella sp. 2205SS18-9]|nr:hypothetical protein [Chengkuizengella sp. 2205SS18-9]
TEHLLEQRKQIENYKPHMVVFKELERSYRKRHGERMIPTCPNCSRGFRFEELSGWVNERFEKGLREKEKSKE